MVNIRKFNKKKIAKSFLDTAMQLYDEEDYLAALHLAGASEEILGKYLKVNNIENALESEVNALVSLSKVLHSEKELNVGEARDLVNRSKNIIKHMNDENDIEAHLDPKEDAKDMLKRAFTNLWRLDESSDYFEIFWNKLDGRM